MGISKVDDTSIVGNERISQERDAVSPAGRARRVQDFWTRTRLIKIVRPGPGPATSLHA